MSSDASRTGGIWCLWTRLRLAAATAGEVWRTHHAGPQRTRRRGRRRSPDLVRLEGRELLSTPGTTITTPIVVNIPFPYPGTLETSTITQPIIITTIGDKANPIVSLSTSVKSAAYGQSVTFVASVSTPIAVGASGTVTFSDGNTTLGTVAVSDSGQALVPGQAILTTSALPVGPQSITATYSGDALNYGVTSSPVAESVSRAAAQVVVAPEPVFKDKKLVSLNLKAEVQATAPGGGLPSGTLTFEVRTRSKKAPEKVLGTTSLSGGTAALPVTLRSVLHKPITIIYGGDVDFASSASSATLTGKELRSLARSVRDLQGREHQH
jgi:Bacterial Ig-like domain (group 3)